MASPSTVVAADATARFAPRRIPLGERVAGVIRRVVPPLVIIAAVLGIWEAAGRWGGLADYILPTPSRIATAFVMNTSLFARHVPITALEAALGFIIGNTAGVLLAILFVHSSTIERGVYPMAVAMRSVPFVALAPILVIWLGNGLTPKVIIAALVSFFPTLVNTTRGLRAVDPEALELMQTLSATPWQVLWRLRWPSAMPFLFSALKISAAGTVLGAVVAEWIGSDVGLGYVVLMTTYEFRIPLLWASIAVTSTMAMTLFGLVILAERLWSYDASGDTGG
jgi:ABC-type nitrate/sulfonate/bicarbonate transport system permease component